jgi:hypothetical protein
MKNTMCIMIFKARCCVRRPGQLVLATFRRAVRSRWARRHPELLRLWNNLPGDAALGGCAAALCGLGEGEGGWVAGDDEKRSPRPPNSLVRLNSSEVWCEADNMKSDVVCEKLSCEDDRETNKHASAQARVGVWGGVSGVST